MHISSEHQGVFIAAFGFCTLVGWRLGSALTYLWRKIGIVRWDWMNAFLALLLFSGILSFEMTTVVNHAAVFTADIEYLPALFIGGLLFGVILYLTWVLVYSLQMRRR
ncbi:MAG: hypothetical protein M3Y21_01385 [Candidatus Eremiobacteraeota bacterium]|nr:hypothetical protein [Candidatus Eremiobacteraeota bacterium]